MNIRAHSLIAILFACACAGNAFAGASDYVSGLWNKVRGTAKVEPCSGDFDLSVSVMPAQGDAQADPDAKIAVSFAIPKGASRGIASRVHTSDKFEIDQQRCSAWQQKYWPMVDAMIRENKRPERANNVCFNVGSIEYRAGGQTVKTHFCLGNAGQDGLTYVFRSFYDGTDRLVAR